MPDQTTHIQSGSHDSHEEMTHHDIAGVPTDAKADGPLFRLVKDRRIAFLGVGGVNTLIGISTFALFDRIYGKGAWQTVATLMSSHVISTLIAFVLYRYLVFRVRGHVLLDLARFESVYLSAVLVNLGLLSLAVDVFGLPRFPVQLALTVLMAVWSYVGHDKFSFRRKKETA